MLSHAKVVWIVTAVLFFYLSLAIFYAHGWLFVLIGFVLMFFFCAWLLKMFTTHSKSPRAILISSYIILAFPVFVIFSVLVKDPSEANPFVTKKEVLIKLIKRKGVQYCDCVEEASSMNNRERKTTEYLKCTESYMISAGELNTSIMDADLNREEEAEVIDVYNQVTKEMDGCMRDAIYK